MSKLRVAILEDNKHLLKDLKQKLDDSGLVEVVAWATNSEDFLREVTNTNPEALFLDIDLGGDSMNGMDIAYKLKLPVLFVSGHNAANLKGIENLKREFDLNVDHLTKSFSDGELIKTVRRFVNDVKASQKVNYVHLDFGISKRNRIIIDTIVYLCTDKAIGADSNNKCIYFSDRKPEVLIDFSFVNMEEKGLSINKFITIHKSFRVNVDKILQYNKTTHEVQVEVFSSAGRSETKMLAVSENYRNEVRKIKS